MLIAETLRNTNHRCLLSQILFIVVLEHIMEDRPTLEELASTNKINMSIQLELEEELERVTTRLENVARVQGMARRSAFSG